MSKIRLYQLACILLLIVIGTLLSRNLENKNDSAAEKETISVIMNRKSVREYRKERPIKDENMETLLKAAMAAPSGRDIRPWEFIVINNRETLDRLAKELPTAKMLAKAPAAIVVCGDSIKSFYWYLDCAAATQNILLTAEALGLGAVWTAVYPYEDRTATVVKHTELPAHILPLAIIPIGYPVGQQTVKNKYDQSRIHTNQW